ncbi:cytochrome c oxidase subunit 2A [Neobacillus notoginsengisoli]|uniref:Cytochrome c oxidase subunit 2A n=1 Tax=Neobacillus notoginsengisoli TaxID=1578198 RepID=A0A417YXM2_9BACI|nr:cytochrome c oxidase subunit 2A [Neobacillus notoginsengisoli]RHW42296.1 cytochrome c oxidase subunit 2A [Neobacillus notoginsengisoli]
MAKTELAKTQSNVKQKVKDDEPVLKGTLISVLLLGAFLILSWAGVYFLFLDRF